MKQKTKRKKTGKKIAKVKTLLLQKKRKKRKKQKVCAQISNTSRRRSSENLSQDARGADEERLGEDDERLLVLCLRDRKSVV